MFIASSWSIILHACLQTRSAIEKTLDWENSHLYNKLGLHWKLTKHHSQSSNMLEYVSSFLGFFLLIMNLKCLSFRCCGFDVGSYPVVQFVEVLLTRKRSIRSYKNSVLFLQVVDSFCLTFVWAMLPRPVGQFFRNPACLFRCLCWTFFRKHRCCCPTDSFFGGVCLNALSYNVLVNRTFRFF